MINFKQSFILQSFYKVDSHPALSSTVNLSIPSAGSTQEKHELTIIAKYKTVCLTL